MRRRPWLMIGTLSGAVLGFLLVIIDTSAGHFPRFFIIACTTVGVLAGLIADYRQTTRAAKKRGPPPTVDS